MGAYLSSPIRDKETEEGENDTFKYGVAAMQGWRTDMEDAHAAVLDLQSDGGGKSALFAVLDGHGGAEVARFVANHLAQEVVGSEAYQANDVERALVQSYLRMDELLVKEEHREELKSLRSKESEEEADSGPMVINGASLPESLLEALGMPSGAGFQIKLVRSGPGARGIAIEDIEEAVEGEEGGEHSRATIVEVIEGEPGEGDDDEEQDAEGEAAKPADGADDEEDSGDAATNPADALERNSKRKREEKKAGMAVDEAAAADTPGSGSDGKEQAAQQQQQAPGDDAEACRADGAREEVTPEKGEDEYLGPSAGCTAVCAVVRGNELFVANAGDSRCVLSRGGTAVAMTQDHKPMDGDEYARIMKAGGFVADGRVNGSLNLSRALGDLEYKQSKELGPEEQMVTAMPEVRREALQPGDEFLILACDGIWDVLTNQEAVDFVAERLAAGKAPREICEEMCDACLAPDTGGCGKGCDNMSVVVVLLKDYAPAVQQGK